MRSKQIPGIIPFLVILLFAFSCQQSPSAEFSVMTWNIWHGGTHGDKASGYEQDSTNTINILKVINVNRPDILLMQETYCCGMQIAKDAGYPYSWRGSSNLSIHSRYPITDTIKIFKPFNSHAVIIEIAEQPLLIVNLWLHYLPDYLKESKTKSPEELIAAEHETRLAEITAIVHAVDSLHNFYGDIPIIMGGDYNSGSHLDWIEEMKTQYFGKIVEWPVSTLMASKDFIDSFREINPIPKLKEDISWGYFSEERISDRIDYVYYKGGNVSATASRIVKEDPEGGFFNSDHRAVLTKFKLQHE